MSTQQIAKFLAWLGVAALIVFAVVGWSLAISRDQTNHDLTATNRKQQPIADFNSARGDRADCITSYTVRFNAHIAAIVIVDRTNQAAVADAVLRLTSDYHDLLSLETLCPKPVKPEFDKDGNVLTGTQIFEQHPASPETIPTPAPTTLPAPSS